LHGLLALNPESNAGVCSGKHPRGKSGGFRTSLAWSAVTAGHGSAASRRQHTNPFFSNGLELRSWFNRKTASTSGPAGVRFLKHIHIDYENNLAGGGRGVSTTSSAG